MAKEEKARQGPVIHLALRLPTKVNDWLEDRSLETDLSPSQLACQILKSAYFTRPERVLVSVPINNEERRDLVEGPFRYMTVGVPKPILEWLTEPSMETGLTPQQLAVRVLQVAFLDDSGHAQPGPEEG